jgi:hypothetical protein
MKRLILTFTLFAFTLTSFSQKKESHVIYNSKGKRVSYKKMLKTIAKKKSYFLVNLIIMPLLIGCNTKLRRI